MPIFTTPISSQNTSFQAGIHSYPNLSQTQQYSISLDEFLRETVTPTGAFQLYTTTALSTGAATIENQKQLLLTTAQTTNDYVGTRTSGASFNRNSVSTDIDLRSQMIMDIIFSIGQTTDTAFFIGWVDGNAALTALPTTARHFGIYCDTSVDNNFHFSSANGTSQVKTDTTLALTINQLRFNVQWTGADTAVMSLYSVTSGNVFSTLVSSVNVTSFYNGAGNRALEFNVWVKDLNNLATKLARCQGWKVQAL